MPWISFAPYYLKHKEEKITATYPQEYHCFDTVVNFDIAITAIILVANKVEMCVRSIHPHFIVPVPFLTLLTCAHSFLFIH